MKLLPFDNKPELQVVVDLPEGSPSRTPNRTLQEIAARIAAVPEIVSFQTYAGAAAPFNFNGLVRHYYLRDDAGARRRAGEPHAEGRARAGQPRHRARYPAAARWSADSCGNVVKVVEPPPGRRCWRRCWPRSTAPIPKPGARSRPKCARHLPACLSSSMSTTASASRRPRVRVRLDQDNLEFNGVEQRDVYDTLRTLQGGTTVGYSHRGGGRQPDPRSGWSSRRRTRVVDERMLSTPVPANALPGNRDAWSSSATSSASAASRRHFRSSATTAAGGNGHGRARRRLRGADLRHARGRRRDRRGGLGQPRQARDRAARPARWTKADRRCCGTASGRSPG